LTFQDDDDGGSYLVFDGVTVAQATASSGSSGSSTSNVVLEPAKWQINPSRKLYYLDNYIGIGTDNPLYRLHVAEGAIKSENIITNSISATEIFTSSDERIKEDIKLTDLSLCLSNIKNLDIYDYNLVNSSNNIVNNNINNNKTGFVAQQVESIIPNAINVNNLHGYEDFRSIDTSVILANLVGAVKMLIEKTF
jgi:hypothetical protein